MELQELVTRARLLFCGAPKRFIVFELADGHRSPKEIARKTRRSLRATLNDLKKMKDYELICTRKDKNEKILKKNGGIIYEKNPLLRHLPKSYFKDLTKTIKKDRVKIIISKKRKSGKIIRFRFPTKEEVLEICKQGEDQIYEFKRAGTELRKITREIAAFANTRMGGIIFYGVEDDGTITGSDKRRQQLDQSLQNSIKNSISPALIVNIQERNVLGQIILIIGVPPWNKKDVYQYEERVCVRKGTNVFGTTPEELRKLHKGEFVV